MTLKNRDNNTKNVGCSSCNRIFKTEASRDQHMKDVNNHHIHIPKGLVNEDGFWVDPKQLTVQRTWGHFECKCKKWWQSAHTSYFWSEGRWAKQQCTKCNRMILPKYVWKTYTWRRCVVNTDTSKCEMCISSCCENNDYEYELQSLIECL